MHFVVAQGQVEGARNLPQVQAAQEEEDREDRVGEQVVQRAGVVVASQRPDDALAGPWRHAPQHGREGSAQQDEHGGDHAQQEVLDLVEGKQVVGKGVQRRLESKEDQEEAKKE